MDHPRKVRPSDLPNKSVRALDGESVRLKVVKADSKSLPQDLLAAFRSNVRSIRTSRRRNAHGSTDATKA